MVYDAEKDYVRDEWNRGVRKFDRSNPYIWKLLENKDHPEVAPFIREYDLDSNTY